MPKNKNNKKLKKKVLEHIKKDDKEFLKQIEEDKKLEKELKKNPVKRRK